MTATSIRAAGLFAPARDADATDAELLGRFVAHRDGPAFSALVARHGPMVFGVCRRVLGDWHSAEDAFQAAFLVLARRAADVSPPGAVGGWLHGVAYRVAKDARRSAFRRSRHEHPVDELPDPPAPHAEPDADFRNVLDAELRKLPAKYRDLLVACDLEGRPRVPVAEALGIPEGTLSSRLAAARRMLADRLARRGVAPAVAAGVVLNGPSLACEVPRAALAAAARIGSDSPGAVPGAVAALADGAIRVMTVRKLLPYSLFLVAATSALAVAATLVANPPPSQHPNVPAAGVAPPAPVRLEPKPAAAVPNRILFWRDGKLVLIDPDGKNETTLAAGDTRFHPSGGWLSPDGKSVAALVPGPLPPDDGGKEAKRRPASLHVFKVGEKGPGTDLGVQCVTFAWSPDGTEIACSEFEDGAWQKLDAKHFAIDVKTKRKTDLQVPRSHAITDWTRDGRYFVTTRFAADKDRPKASVVLVDRGGWHFGFSTDADQNAVLGKASPDRKRVLYMLVTLQEETPAERKAREEVGAAPPKPKHQLAVVDVETKKATPIADVPLNAEVQGYCWSPDGKRIAYTWRQVHDGKPEDVTDKETESHLVVCDPDGKNQKTLLTEKGKGQWHAVLGGVDWR